MGHILIVELPGGDDTDILAAAQRGGHRVSFLTADPAYYRANEVKPWFADFAHVIDIHFLDPFDALLCLQDLRIVEAAQLAAELRLRHVNVDTARLCRDKAAVRARLADAGIIQPDYAETEGPEELLAAVSAMGLPLLIKPADGFGSQNIFALRTENDLAAVHAAPQIISAASGNYGLGVHATGRMLAERLMEGQVVGCDTMSAEGRHMLIGVNEKLFFPPPSFAIRGGCFSANMGQFGELERYASDVLDAVGFDHGAAHIELILTEEGPRVIEINPRMVGARIGRLIGASLGRSFHAMLIDLHMAGVLPRVADVPRYAVSRWLAARTAGRLQSLEIASCDSSLFLGAEILAKPGDLISSPYDNADRLACVMTCGSDRISAEALAEQIVIETHVEITEAI